MAMFNSYVKLPKGNQGPKGRPFLQAPSFSSAKSTVFRGGNLVVLVLSHYSHICVFVWKYDTPTLIDSRQIKWGISHFQTPKYHSIGEYWLYIPVISPIHPHIGWLNTIFICYIPRLSGSSKCRPYNFSWAWSTLFPDLNHPKLDHLIPKQPRWLRDPIFFFQKPQYQLVDPGPIFIIP